MTYIKERFEFVIMDGLKDLLQAEVNLFGHTADERLSTGVCLLIDESYFNYIDGKVEPHHENFFIRQMEDWFQTQLPYHELSPMHHMRLHPDYIAVGADSMYHWVVNSPQRLEFVKGLYNHYKPESCNKW